MIACSAVASWFVSGAAGDDDKGEGRVFELLDDWFSKKELLRQATAAGVSPRWPLRFRIASICVGAASWLIFAALALGVGLAS